MEEWLIATINKENLLSPENIEKCFKIIDQDGGNTISIDEIKNQLFSGQDIDSHIMQHVMKGVDEDGDGELDIEEFQKIMTRMLQLNEKKVQKAVSIEHSKVSEEVAATPVQSFKRRASMIFTHNMSN